MRRFSIPAALLVGLAADPRIASKLEPDQPLAKFEDYRRTAGSRVADTLVAAFELRKVRWRPEADSAAELIAMAFVEPDKPASVPGPLLRVTAGGWVRVVLRNSATDRIAVFGLQDHLPNAAQDSVSLAPGAEASVTFRATAPGTYYYWGLTRRPRPAGAPPLPPRAPPPRQFPGGNSADGPFVGALIVDPAGVTPPANEQILMITRWFDGAYPGIDSTGVWKMMVNGASWPHTTRFNYTVGDTVHWRVINPMLIWHPMHLHGFYFNVTARGDNRVDTLYTLEQKRAAVTELMTEASTMALTWVPDRPGNWLFHCHLIKHMSLIQRIGPPLDSTRAATPHAGHQVASGAERAEDHMAGLVVGITVQPKSGKTAAAELAMASGKTTPARSTKSLRLFATTRPRVFGDAPGYSFILQQGTRTPARDSARLPGSPIILHRGEPSRITVLNTLGKPLAVHWHGMEIESWFDGVGGWSGAGSSVRPSIAPGDSFMVHMTPRRTGTFIYHSHDETGEELASGLYGPLLVLEPGATLDSTRDHIVMMGLRGPGKPQFAVNGDTMPAPLALSSGVSHRLRLVSIPASEEIVVDLMRRDSLAVWRPLARDGADLPAGQQISRASRELMSAGQTLDVEITPDSAGLAAGEYALRFRLRSYPALVQPVTTTILKLIAAPRSGKM